VATFLFCAAGRRLELGPERLRAMIGAWRAFLHGRAPWDPAQERTF
jgi:hypothetical protein